MSIPVNTQYKTNKYIRRYAILNHKILNFQHFASVFIEKIQKTWFNMIFKCFASCAGVEACKTCHVMSCHMLYRSFSVVVVCVLSFLGVGTICAQSHGRYKRALCSLIRCGIKYTAALHISPPLNPTHATRLSACNIKHTTTLKHKPDLQIAHLFIYD